MSLLTVTFLSSRTQRGSKNIPAIRSLHVPHSPKFYSYLVTTKITGPLHVSSFKDVAKLLKFKVVALLTTRVMFRVDGGRLKGQELQDPPENPSGLKKEGVGGNGLNS